MTLHNYGLTWRKSTRSAAAGHCVEVAAVAWAVFVRDSKDVAGPMLEFGADGWSEFLSGVRAGEFDHAR